MDPESISMKIEFRAEELYEASRKHVSGRPRWADLDPNDPYDMGMREVAYANARQEFYQDGKRA